MVNVLFILYFQIFNNINFLFVFIVSFMGTYVWQLFFLTDGRNWSRVYCIYFWCPSCLPDIVFVACDVYDLENTENMKKKKHISDLVNTLTVTTTTQKTKQQSQSWKENAYRQRPKNLKCSINKDYGCIQYS